MKVHSRNYFAAVGKDERVAGVIQRMRPRAQAAADAALAEAMERHTDEVFARTAERLASKARQRRKPSA